jgi:hypothetical protein
MPKRKKIETAVVVKRKPKIKPIVVPSITKEAQLSNSQAVIAKMEEEQKTCVGQKDIIRFKMLNKKIAEEKKKIQELQENKLEFQIQELATQISKMKSVTFCEKYVLTPVRLYPGVGVKLSSNREPNRIALRGYEKQYALLTGGTIETRKHHIDMCDDCGIDRILDKETAKRTCPKCGDYKKLESHIFELKDTDKDEQSSQTDQSLSHLQKFSAQFEQGHPSAPKNVLEKMCIEYNKIHTLDHSKVQCSRTSQFIKSSQNIPKVFRKAPDRLSKELISASIPEFTSQEINKLLNQRSQLRSIDISEISQKTKKSYTNPIYMRQFGLANNMPQASLFLHAKTNKIHLDRTRNLEEECLIQAAKKTKPNSDLCWDLKPFS